MAKSSSNFDISIVVQPHDDGYVCEATSTQRIDAGLPMRSCGQTPDHAIANALENVARAFRKRAEAEQKIDWDAVDRSSSGQVIDKRFHVIVHYERVVNDESKFEAMVSTQLGNTIVENAEFTLIRVDPGLPIEPSELVGD